MMACKRGQARVVETLVACGSEICIRDNKNRTATHIAVARKNSSCLTYLSTQVRHVLIVYLLAK
jgi:ankyrin repeat protein